MTRSRVLVVEDQPLIATDLCQTLRAMGYDVLPSLASGEEAVVSAIEQRPELILMDIRLRGPMDGIQAAMAIRDRLDVPIVYLTAYADDETIKRAKLTGPFGYLLKPFNERELRAAIEIALYKHATDRLLAEERARRVAAEEYKLFVDGVEDYAIFIIDVTGRVASWNAGAARIYGYSTEEILGRYASVFHTSVHVESGRPGAELEAAAVAGRVESDGWRLRKDGSRFWANVVITALRDERGRLRGFGDVTRDITARRQVERENERLYRQAQHAIRARDEFLAIASHELRTPLSALVLQLDGLAKTYGELSPQARDPKVSSKIEKSVKNASRLERLIDNLDEDVPGVLANVVADTDHWLSSGYDAAVALYTGSGIYQPLNAADGTNVFRFAGADDLVASGYLWEENRAQLAYKPFVMVQPQGAGMVIGFTQSPVTRAYLNGLDLLLANAILFGPSHTR